MYCLIEPLEGRRMMSTTPPALDITLAFDPNLQVNVLTINNATDVLVTERVVDFNTGARGVIVESGTQSRTYTGDFDVNGTALNVGLIVINGTAGDDIISLVDDDIRATISTGNGRDQIFVSGHAPASVFASTNALITIDAGNGKDSILVTDVDSYNILSSHGTDTIEIDTNAGL